MRKHLFFLASFTFIIVFFGCKENDTITNPNNNFLKDNVIVPFSPIDSKITLRLIEEISPKNRNVVLICSTEKTYSPGGTKIVSTITQEKDTFKIAFNDLLISNNGPAIFSPATADFDLNTLKVGSYYLDISINGKKLLCLIKVTDDSFKLKIQPNNIIRLYNDVLYRVPKTIIWGQAESIEPAPYQLFLDSLVVLGAKSHNLSAGDYFYFTVDDNGGFDTHSVLGMPYGNYFLFNFEGDTTLTRNLVKRFAKRYLDSIYIRLSGGRGEEYYSTVLKNGT